MVPAADRDHVMDIDTGRKRGERRSLAEFARPQHGVDTLLDAFPDSQSPPPGVVDVHAGGDEG